MKNTGNYDLDGDFSIIGQIISSAASVAPIAVVVGALWVANLDVDKLDGKHASDFAPVSHVHNAADITAGTLDILRLPFEVIRGSGAPGFVPVYGSVPNSLTYGGLQFDISTGSLAIGFSFDPSSKLSVAGNTYASGYSTASRFISNVATGSAPFTVASITRVDNLNVQYLNGQEGSYYLDWNNFTNKPTIGLGSVTSVALTAPTGFAVSGSPITTAGTLGLSFAAGYSLPTTAKQTQWDTAYGWGNHAGLYAPISHVGAGGAAHANVTNLVAGFMSATDKVKLDALPGNNVTSPYLPFFNGTTWENTNIQYNLAANRVGFGGAPSYSVDIYGNVNIRSILRLNGASGSNGDFLRSSGAGTPTWATLDTSAVLENANLYFTQARVLSTPLTGYTAGTNTPIDSTSTVLGGFRNLQAQITAIGGGMTGYVPTSRTLTINGNSFDLTANRSWSVGTVTSVGLTMPTGFSVASSPITSSGTFGVTFTAGYSLPSDATQATWTAKQAALSGTGIVKSTAGVISYLTDNSGNWNTSFGWGNHAGLYAPIGHVGSGGSAHANATTSVAGFMSSSDKTKLDDTASGVGPPGFVAVFNSGNTFTYGALQFDVATGSMAIGFSFDPSSKLSVTGNTWVSGYVSAARYISTVVTGTAPLTIASTTRVDNLNVQYLNGQEGSYYLDWTNFTNKPTIGLGSVTSVGLSAPTGFAVSGSPVTTSGTLALSFTAGYSLPTTAKQTQWDTAYTWGNHAGLYRPISYVPAWTDITGKPTTFAPAAHTLDSHSNVTITSIATNQLIRWSGSAWVNWTPTFGAGSVTSVGLSAPTGFTVSGSPVTTSGTLALSFTAGYSLPSDATQATWTAKQAALSGTGIVKSVAGTISYLTDNSGNWNTAFGWGNHAGLYRPISYVPDWADITGKPTTFTPSAHTLDSHSNVTVTSIATNQVLRWSGSAWVNWTPTFGAGSVTSVGLSAPTGFAVSGSPVTTSGTLALAFSAGYSLPSDATQATWTAKQAALSGTGIVKSVSGTISYLTDNSANWDAAFSWGNHTGSYVLKAENLNTDSTKNFGSIRGIGVHALALATGYPTTNGIAVEFSSGYGANASSYPRDFTLFKAHSLPDYYFRNYVTATGVSNSFVRIWHSGDFTSTNISNWNTAFGWGNPSGVYLPLTGGTITGDLFVSFLKFRSTSTGDVISRNGAVARILIRPNGDAVNTNQVAFEAAGTTSIITEGQISVTKSTGLSPFIVASTTRVDNLNVQYLNGQEGSYYLDWTNFTNKPTIGVGSVTSVGLAMPTGFTVSGSPVTGSGTLTASFTAGYSLPTTAKQTQWDAAYGWGDFKLRNVNTSTGLTGGGNLSTDRTISFDTTWGDARYTLASSAVDRFISLYRTDNLNLAVKGGVHVVNSPASNIPETYNTVFTFVGNGSTGNGAATGTWINQLIAGTSADWYVRNSIGDWSSFSTTHQIWTSKQFTSTNISNWTTAYGWGNHSGVYVRISTADSISAAHNFSGQITLSGHGFHNTYDGTNVYDHYFLSGGNGATNTFANLRVWNGPGATIKTLRFGGDGSFSWDGQDIATQAWVTAQDRFNSSTTAVTNLNTVVNGGIKYWVDTTTNTPVASSYGTVVTFAGLTNTGNVVNGGWISQIMSVTNDDWYVRRGSGTSSTTATWNSTYQLWTSKQFTATQVSNWVSGGGALTSGYLPAATGSNTLINSVIRYSGSLIGIGVIPQNHTLHVAHGFAKTDTSNRNIAFFGSNESNVAHGLSIGAVGHASSQAQRRVSLDIVENNTASGGTLNLMPYAGWVVIGSNNIGTEVLDVTGNIKFSGALKPGGSAGTSGQVLISTGGGTNTWATISGSSDTWQNVLARGNVATTRPIISSGPASGGYEFLKFQPTDAGSGKHSYVFLTDVAGKYTFYASDGSTYGITNFLGSLTVNDQAVATASNSMTFTNKSGNISQWTNNSGYIVSANIYGQYSITGGGNAGSSTQYLSLVNDSSSPGNNMLYGTNGSGTKGWYSQPSGGGGSDTWQNVLSRGSVATTMPTISVGTSSGGYEFLRLRPTDYGSGKHQMSFTSSGGGTWDINIFDGTSYGTLNFNGTFTIGGATVLTASNSSAISNKTGDISMWNNNVGYTTSSVVAGYDSIYGSGYTGGSPIYLNLIGDQNSPGASKYYGTNSGGSKGWYSLPSGGSGITGLSSYSYFSIHVLEVTTPSGSSRTDMWMNGLLLLKSYTASQLSSLTLLYTGMMAYQTDGTPGFYGFNGSSWVFLG